MTKRTPATESGSDLDMLFDWDMYNAIAALKGIGDLLNPDKSGDLPEYAREPLFFAIEPLATLALERATKMQVSLDNLAFEARAKQSESGRALQ